VWSNHRWLVAGNNLYASIEPNDSRPRLAPHDLEMIELATAAMGSVHLLLCETPAMVPRTEVLGVKFTARIVARPPWSSGVSRSIASPVLVERIWREARSCSHVYARLPSVMGLLAVKVARHLGMPYVVSVHGDVKAANPVRNQARPIMRSARRARAQYHDIRIRRAIRGAEMALFVGRGLASNYLSRSTSTPSVVFMNCLQEREDVFQRNPGRLSGRSVRLLFVGRLWPAKGLDVLLRAMPMLEENVTLSVVGEGREMARSRELVDRLGLGARVTFEGWQDRASLEDYYHAADLMVIPSRTEGVPKVALEALVRGLPIVGTSVGDLPALLGANERGRLVSPIDADALADAIRRAIVDRDYTMLMAERGLAYARTATRGSMTERIRLGFREHVL
jgi:phosphatidyl-myo-inositol dimannoside synthase